MERLSRLTEIRQAEREGLRAEQLTLVLNIIKQASSMKGFRVETMLPGISINTDQDDFAPIESVQLMKFDGKKWEFFGEVLGK